MTRVALVGHIEWVDFVPVAKYPRRGSVLHADGSFARAGGGGGVAAAMLADLGAEVDFFCALGQDAHGSAAQEQLRERGVTMHVAWREQPTRRAVTLLEPAGERTIVTIGERLGPRGVDELPWELLQQADGVYFTAGDRAALAHARGARILTASPRGGDPLQGDGVPIDALIFSAHDHDEEAVAQQVGARARLMVATEGGDGGRWWGASSGRWEPVPVPGEPRDTYGCGDSFAAGFTFGLARGEPVAQAATLGAECGARCLTRSGAP
ncbi:MAG: ribokinase [Solirubrobacteraceae bacterium]|jgi:ribokinase|nr:ribokinase [Solirubrobacteraceae bacterium]